MIIIFSGWGALAIPMFVFSVLGLDLFGTAFIDFHLEGVLKFTLKPLEPVA